MANALILLGCGSGGAGGTPDPGDTLLFASGGGSSLLLADGSSFLLLSGS